ncbi:MAG TPA: hypothetical protein DCS63_07245 [Elusimicrobia bacterium]|nr:hypothetical protein [Elusimicrobiota bacterium]
MKKNMETPQAAISRQIRLAVAGFGLNFKSYSPGIISILEKRYGRFSCPGHSGYEMELVEDRGSQNPFKPAVSFDGRTLKIKRGDFDAVIDTRARTGVVKVSPTEQCLDAFLRSLLSFLLIRSGGFMLHSAGLVKGGKAYLFPGISGAGKSTLSKLAAGSGGGGVISDEINILRLEKGRWRAFGSPFWGEMRADGRPGSWTLGGIYLLKKSAANGISICAQAQSYKTLLRCLVNFSKDAKTAALVMANTARLVSASPAGQLKFSKENADFLRLIG